MNRFEELITSFEPKLKQNYVILTNNLYNMIRFCVGGPKNGNKLMQNSSEGCSDSEEQVFQEYLRTSRKSHQTFKKYLKNAFPTVAKSV